MKYILIALLFFANLTLSNAQSFGVKGGARFDNSKIEGIGAKTNTKTRFEAGAFVAMALPGNDSWEADATLLYSNQGFKLSHAYLDNTGITYHFDIHRLKLPLTIKKKFSIGNISPFLRAGLYASYSISGRMKSGDSDESLKYKDNSDKMNYGGLAGIGVELTSHIGLNIDYDISFSESNIMLGNQSFSIKDRGCTASLSYRF